MFTNLCQQKLFDVSLLTEIVLTVLRYYLLKEVSKPTEMLHDDPVIEWMFCHMLDYSSIHQFCETIDYNFRYLFYEIINYYF